MNIAKTLHENLLHPKVDLKGQVQNCIAYECNFSYNKVIPLSNNEGVFTIRKFLFIVCQDKVPTEGHLSCSLWTNSPKRGVCEVKPQKCACQQIPFTLLENSFGKRTVDDFVSFLGNLICFVVIHSRLWRHCF